MADGKKHTAAAQKILKCTTRASIAVAVAGAPFTSGTSVVVGIGLIIGSWVGLILTPDIDHHMTTIEEIRMKRINLIWGAVWQLYWTPYQILIPHRSIWSHDPVLPGTIIRFIYLLWYPLIWTYSNINLDLFVIFWLSVFTGQCIQDIRHAQLDKWRFHK